MSALYKLNESLISKVEKLELENKQLKNRADSLRDLLGSEICKYFEMSNSLKETKKRFYYDNISECYQDLRYFYGCSEPIQNADDYKEYYKEIFNRDYPQDDDKDEDEDEDEDEDDSELINI